MHPLDRPVWTALATRQSHLAIGGARARRFDPAVAMFAAAADDGAEAQAALAALLAPGEAAIQIEARETPVPDGLVATRRVLVQMLAERVAPPEDAETGGIVALAPGDWPEMLALATLTAPGPFFARTPSLAQFIGIRQDGRLVAMAGERLRVPGYSEVSGVCTHPDARGRGYGGLLTRAIAARIASRGETPFLTAYADNHPAIALYEALGFVLRARPIFTRLERPA